MNIVLRLMQTVFKKNMLKLTSTADEGHALPDDLIELADLMYEGSGGVKLAADILRPADRLHDPLPIACFIHGGGFVVGSRKANRVYRELLAQRGYVVFDPEYRLIDETDAIGEIEDVCASLSYLYDHAAEFGGDLSRILMIGESAGGFLALYATALMASPLLQEKLGIEMPEISARGLACFGGMFYTARFDIIGLVYRRAMYGDRRHDSDFMALMDPENPRVTTRLPPVLQATSGADFMGKYTLRLNEALTMAGHDHRLIYYREGAELTHAFPSLLPELPESKEVLDELDAWFRGL